MLLLVDICEPIWQNEFQVALWQTIIEKMEWKFVSIYLILIQLCGIY